jgi:hypothetical protein
MAWHMRAVTGLRVSAPSRVNRARVVSSGDTSYVGPLPPEYVILRYRRPADVRY